MYKVEPLLKSLVFEKYTEGYLGLPTTVLGHPRTPDGNPGYVHVHVHAHAGVQVVTIVYHIRYYQCIRGKTLIIWVCIKPAPSREHCINTFNIDKPPRSSDTIILYMYLALSSVADEDFPIAPKPTPTARPSKEKNQCFANRITFTIILSCPDVIEASVNGIYQKGQIIRLHASKGSSSSESTQYSSSVGLGINILGGG